MAEEDRNVTISGLTRYHEIFSVSQSKLFSFKLLNDIPEAISPSKEKVYFGSWFWRFQFKIGQPLSLGLWQR
jgi:hypothetical protein